jgi:hypothetical protein
VGTKYFVVSEDIPSLHLAEELTTQDGKSR